MSKYIKEDYDSPETLILLISANRNSLTNLLNKQRDLIPSLLDNPYKLETLYNGKRFISEKGELLRYDVLIFKTYSDNVEKEGLYKITAITPDDFDNVHIPMYENSLFGGFDQYLPFIRLEKHPDILKLEKELQKNEEVLQNMQDVSEVYENFKKTIKANEIKQHLKESIEKISDYNTKFKNFGFTQQDLDDIKKYNILPDCIDFTPNGTHIVYTGSLNFENQDFKELPRFLQTFKTIKGDLIIKDCKNLNSLKNLENLEHVRGSLNISGTNIKNFKGLENLKNVGTYEGVSKTRGRFDYEFICTNNIRLTSCEGLENLELIDGSVSFQGCLLLSDVTALKHTIISGNIVPEFIKFKINPTPTEEITLDKNFERAKVKAKEILKSCKENGIDHSKVTVDSDGLCIYDGILIFNYPNFSDIPDTLKYFKELKGDLIVMGFDNLKDLKNLENLRKVKDIFLGACENLTDISALKGLKEFGTIKFENCENLAPFKDSTGRNSYNIYTLEMLQDYFRPSNQKTIKIGADNGKFLTDVEIILEKFEILENKFDRVLNELKAFEKCNCKKDCTSGILREGQIGDDVRPPVTPLTNYNR